MKSLRRVRGFDAGTDHQHTGPVMRPMAQGARAAWGLVPLPASRGAMRCEPYLCEVPRIRGRQFP